MAVNPNSITDDQLMHRYYNLCMKAKEYENTHELETSYDNKYDMALMDIDFIFQKIDDEEGLSLLPDIINSMDDICRVKVDKILRNMGC